jgi:hypothetical protein
MFSQNAFLQKKSKIGKIQEEKAGPRNIVMIYDVVHGYCTKFQEFTNGDLAI